VAGSVSTSGGNVVLTVPGPIAGGTSFTPPEHRSPASTRGPAIPVPA
jgi:dehydratase